MVRCSEQERLVWLPIMNQQVQQHDGESLETQKANYFVAPHFYCVETICAPCDVVIAWTLFDKSESPTKILNWLDVVYPTSELRHNYISIDKACMVLQTAVSNGS